MRLLVVASLALSFSISVFAGCCNPAGNNVPGYSICSNNPNQCCNNAGQSNNSITPQNCNQSNGGSTSGGSSSGGSSSSGSCTAPAFLISHKALTLGPGSNQLGSLCKMYMGQNPGTTQCCVTWDQVQSACTALGAVLVNYPACSSSVWMFGPVKNGNITKTCCKPN